MKMSNLLNMVTVIIVFILIIYWLIVTINTPCFSLYNFLISFGTLFANILINILAALGK